MRPFQQLPGSRRSQFLELDQPALRPLADTPYVYAEWKKAKVGVDYHVALAHHYYSVPYRHRGHVIDMRITRTVVECFYKNKCIATHQRCL